MGWRIMKKEVKGGEGMSRKVREGKEWKGKGMGQKGRGRTGTGKTGKGKEGKQGEGTGGTFRRLTHEYAMKETRGGEGGGG